MSWLDILRKTSAESEKSHGDASPESNMHNNTIRKTPSSSFTNNAIPIPANSWGMLLVKQLRDGHATEFDDILHHLIHEKTMLMLPVSCPKHPSASIDREFIEDHVFTLANASNVVGVTSLSGIRALIQDDDIVLLGLFPPEIKPFPEQASDRIQSSSFSGISLDLSSITSDHPGCKILATHLKIPLNEKDSVTAMIINRPIPKEELSWSDTQPGLSDKVLPNLSMEQTTNVLEFEKAFRKNRPHSATLASEMVRNFLDQEHSWLLQHGEDNIDFDLQIDAMETHLCDRLYDILFSMDVDESSQDEALQSRIAALNILDLKLDKLGVLTDDTTETSILDAAIKLAGKSLQQLNDHRGTMDKLNVLVQTHQILVEAIESFSCSTKDAPVPKEPKSDTVELSPSSVMEPLEEEQITTNVDEPSQSVPEPDTTKHSSISRSANTDSLLPLLIFTIVKSNPTNFLSNLMFIQRFRRPNRVSGKESYCLTNMMAAVSYLESTSMSGFGLPHDRVFRQENGKCEYTYRPISNSTDFNATRTIHKDAAEQAENKNFMSDVVGGFGRLWQKKEPTNKDKFNWWMTGSTSSESLSKETDHRKGPRELEEMAVKKDNTTTKRRPRSDSLRSFFSPPSTTVSPTPRQIVPEEGPIQRFLDMRSVEELTIGDVIELLADYKRLAAIIKQSDALKQKE